MSVPNKLKRHHTIGSLKPDPIFESRRRRKLRSTKQTKLNGSGGYFRFHHIRQHGGHINKKHHVAAKLGPFADKFVMIHRAEFTVCTLVCIVGLQVQYFTPAMGDFTGYRMRSPFGRAVLARLQEDNAHRDDKHEHWYHVDKGRLSEELCEKFVALHQDEETKEFLDSCVEKADSVITQIFQSLAQSVLGLFMTKTSINGLLGRGSMFVLSHQHFEKMVGLSPVRKAENLIDLGAGDGEVTKVMASYFSNVYATEMSPTMRRLLSSKGFRVLEVESWDNGSVTYDVISCLNLLDRCDKPVTLLHAMRRALRPGTGRVIIALVLPFKPYVEFDSEDHTPTERLQLTSATFEEQVTQLTIAVFRPAGFEVETFSRLPYLCEGDLRHSFYVLNDAVFVLKAASS